jgi:hypothetical protein
MSGSGMTIRRPQHRIGDHRCRVRRVDRPAVSRGGDSGGEAGIGTPDGDQRGGHRLRVERRMLKASRDQVPKSRVGRFDPREPQRVREADPTVVAIRCEGDGGPVGGDGAGEVARRAQREREVGRGGSRLRVE